MTQKRLFTGIQPTGDLTIGNLISLKKFLEKQQENDFFFCVVDLHSITVPRDPKELLEKTENLFALYIAMGVDPNKSTLFVQSHVKQHAELGWLLTCNSYMGELSRMTQFKEKSEKHKSVPAGIFNYPTLMAADILLYDTDGVPIGADQKQHVELTRDIAERMNAKYGSLFKIPTPIIARGEEGAKIMALDNPTLKMSKSSDNPLSKVCISYQPDQIKKSIMKAATDSESLIKYDPETKAGVSNLIVIYSAYSGKSISDIEKEFEGRGYGDLKKATVTVLSEEIGKIQKEVEIIKSSGEIKKLMKLGAEKALHVAEPVMSRVRKAMGLIEL